MNGDFSHIGWQYQGSFFKQGTNLHLPVSLSRRIMVLFPAFLVIGTSKNHRSAQAIVMRSFIVKFLHFMGLLDWRWVAWVQNIPEN